VTRCPRCYLQTRVCVCSEVARVAARTRIVIVRHVLEAARRSNSGRYVAMALSGTEILDYGAAGRAFDDAPLRAPGTWLLYPDGPAPPAGARPERLVVLDASWSQARRMYRRIDALRGMPVFALPAPAAAPDQLRTPPRPGALATIEAVARALDRLGEPGPAAALDRLYALIIERSRGTATYRR
jgi:DTW domain-containing protein YfiP